MTPIDELSLWSAQALLRAGDFDLQTLVLEDLEEQVRAGKSLDHGLKSLQSQSRQAGDFGMEIGAAMLAPVIVELMKEFWSSFFKEAAEATGKDAAEWTVEKAKKWLGQKSAESTSPEMEKLVKDVESLVAQNKMSTEDGERLVAAANAGFHHELLPKS
jgi:hypothetical protein